MTGRTSLMQKRMANHWHSNYIWPTLTSQEKQSDLTNCQGVIPQVDRISYADALNGQGNTWLTMAGLGLRASCPPLPAAGQHSNVAAHLIVCLLPLLHLPISVLLSHGWLAALLCLGSVRTAAWVLCHNSPSAAAVHHTGAAEIRDPWRPERTTDRSLQAWSFTDMTHCLRQRPVWGFFTHWSLPCVHALITVGILGWAGFNLLTVFSKD